MQRQDQLTADSAFKFALWRQLWAVHGPTDWHTSTPEVEAAIAAHIDRIALPALHRALPRRIVQPCCMTGTCVSRGPLFTHAALHAGRAEICLTHPVAVRDEACWCVAHFAASGIPQPASLSVSRYRATEADTQRPHQGLHCLLTHVQLHRITFTDVTRWQDAQAVLAELASLLLRQGRLSSSAAGIVPSPARCTSLSLCRVPTPSLSMSRFLRLATMVDGLTELTLESCGMGDLHAVTEYVRLSQTLQRLDLSGNDYLALTDWTELGGAVAAGASVSFLSVSRCGWTPAHLELFLAAWVDFRPRPNGIVLDLSGQRGLSVEYCLSAIACLAPLAARPQLVGLFLNDLGVPAGANAALSQLASSHREVAAGAGIALCFSHLPRLCQLAVVAPEARLGGGLETSLCQRVMRGVGEGGAWQWLDLTGQPLSLAPLKRLLQAASFTSGATLHLRRVALGDAMGKLPALGLCLQQLHHLDLASCQIGDAALTQLATAMERAAPLPLHTLNLDDNPFESAFPFLCKGLRAHCLPQLRALHLSGTKLSVRPTLTLIDQVSSTIQSLVTHNTTFADSIQDRTLVLTTLARRQRGDPHLRFVCLDWWCAPGAGRAATDEPETHSRELQDWLHRQTEVRLLRRME